MYSQAKESETLVPIECFNINGRELNLYVVHGRTRSAPFSLYWNDEQNPVQHGMTQFEVFSVLADLLNGADNEKKQ